MTLKQSAGANHGCLRKELELEPIQPHMTQKPVLRGEVGCACVARKVSVERSTRRSSRTSSPCPLFLLNPEFSAEAKAKELTLSDSRLIPALEVIVARVLSESPADELLLAVASSLRR